MLLPQWTAMLARRRPAVYWYAGFAALREHNTGFSKY